MATLNAIISRRIDVAPGVWIIYVTPDGWELSDFDPGHYVSLGLPGTHPRCEEANGEEALENPEKLIKRAYSIASSPNERNHLEFYLVLVEEGGLTPRLFPLHAGDRVWLGKKITGTFVLSRAPQDANLVFVATGTGIAPFISMLRTMLTSETRRHVSLLHGVRHTSDLGYREELLSMERLSPYFSYLPTVSRPQLEKVPWQGRTGYVQHIWQSRVLNEIWGVEPTPENTHVYLCGSPQMIDDSIKLLGKERFVEHTRKEPGQIHVERYW